MSEQETEIRDRLNSLPSVCGPVVGHALRYLRYSPSVASDGTLNIGYTPWVAPEAYGFHLFAPAKREWLLGFSRRSGRDIPDVYDEFLLSMNGCFAYGLSLYGLPASLQAHPPLLNRSKIQPLDLGAANLTWRKGFPVSETEFHFGGRRWSHTENVGYFWDGNRIRSVRKSGETEGAWAVFQEFLIEELSAAERSFRDNVPEIEWH